MAVKRVVEENSTIKETIVKKSLIYVGPDIKNIAKKHAIFINLPQTIIDFKKQCPEIEHLLVAVGEDFRLAAKALSEKGSILSHYYEIVSNFIKAKGV